MLACGSYFLIPMDCPPADPVTHAGPFIATGRVCELPRNGGFCTNVFCETCYDPSMTDLLYNLDGVMGVGCWNGDYGGYMLLGKPGSVACKVYRRTMMYNGAMRRCIIALPLRIETVVLMAKNRSSPHSPVKPGPCTTYGCRTCYHTAGVPIVTVASQGEFHWDSNAVPIPAPGEQIVVGGRQWTVYLVNNGRSEDGRLPSRFYCLI